MNDKWYESLGEAVNRLAQTYITPIEKGKVIEKIYQQMLKEDERDAREKFNRAQAHYKGRRDENPQARDCKYIKPEDR
jgi:truncated hemoglobin YjbI